MARCVQLDPCMVAQRTKNGLKIAGALAMLGLVLAVMLLGPELRQSAAPTDSMRLPSMSNLPPPGSLQVEIERTEGEPSDTVILPSR